MYVYLVCNHQARSQNGSFQNLLYNFNVSIHWKKEGKRLGLKTPGKGEKVFLIPSTRETLGILVSQDKGDSLERSGCCVKFNVTIMFKAFQLFSS